MQATKTYEILAIDIETTGAFLTENEIVSIGYVFGDKDGKITEKGRVDFKVKKPFDVRCYAEFWSKNMQIYDNLQANAIEPNIAIKKFAEIIDRHEAKNELRIVTDFAAFDPCWINYYFSFFLKRLPLYYTHDIKFRPIYDIDSYTRGVMHMNYENPWTNDSVVIEQYKLSLSQITPHYPEEDAQHIYEFHIQLIKALRK